jgi:hypothetical protein
MSRERNVLSQILKSWAQDHDTGFAINAPETGDIGVRKTGEFFTWVIKNSDTNQIDLVTLLDRLELYVSNVKNKKYPDGLFCRKCKTWYQFAEPNQEDGTLLCYSCRNNPYP